MKFYFSKHVQEQLEKRKISKTLIEQVLETPGQTVPEVDNLTCFQSQVTIDGKRYLVRVIVNTTVHPPVVVTAYRTTKIQKYWRES
ncbi:MAG: DUF4258 domain-containing protein [Nitrospirota bacterium]